MTKYWFTSDTHYGHENIIKYCNRPFKSVEHMNIELTRLHNERVKPEDIVFHLGDFCFRNTEGGKEGEGITDRAWQYMNKLNGKIIVIKGNHDNNNSTKTILNSAIIEIGHQEIHLVHNPMDYHQGYKINFIGHIHQQWMFRNVGRSDLINVGVDVHRFMPVDIQEIMDKYNRWKKGIIDDNGKFKLKVKTK